MGKNHISIRTKSIIRHQTLTYFKILIRLLSISTGFFESQQFCREKYAVVNTESIWVVKRRVKTLQLKSNELVQFLLNQRVTTAEMYTRTNSCRQHPSHFLGLSPMNNSFLSVNRTSFDICLVSSHFFVISASIFGTFLGALCFARLFSILSA